MRDTGATPGALPQPLTIETMSDHIEQAKRALRADLRERRQMMSDAAREHAGDGIRAQLDDLVERVGARSVSCYLSTPTEPGTRGFVDAAVRRGIRVLLPITRTDGLLDWSVAVPGGDVTEGILGMPEPVGEVLRSEEHTSELQSLM